MLLLISQITICSLFLIQSTFLYTCKRTPRNSTAYHCKRIGYRRTVTSQRVRSLQCQVRQCWLKSLKPTLLMSIPCTGNIPCRHPAGRTALTQSIGTLITNSTIHRILSFIRIGSIAKEGCTTLVLIYQSIIFRVILYTFFKYLISIVGYLTHTILHTPTTEPCRMTVVTVGFHTTIEIYDVIFIEYIVITDGCTHIPSKKTVVGALINTTIR